VVDHRDNADNAIAGYLVSTNVRRRAKDIDKLHIQPLDFALRVIEQAPMMHLLEVRILHHCGSNLFAGWTGSDG
jgi:hypothetical protein